MLIDITSSVTEQSSGNGGQLRFVGNLGYFYAETASKSQANPEAVWAKVSEVFATDEWGYRH